MLNEFGGVIFTDELANRAPEEWECVRPVQPTQWERAFYAALDAMPRERELANRPLIVSPKVFAQLMRDEAGVITHRRGYVPPSWE